MAHQLPGSPSSFSCSEMLCQGQEKHHSSTQNGQHHSSGICEQNGGNSVSQAEHHSQGAMALVHELGHLRNIYQEPSTHTCRRGVSSNEGLVRLDVESKDLQQDPAEMGSTIEAD